MGKGISKINDHVTMVSAGGKEKDIPLDLLSFWIDTGKLDEVGYRFKDEAAAKTDLDRWQRRKAEIAARAKLKKGTVMANEGIAGAHMAGASPAGQGLTAPVEVEGVQVRPPEPGYLPGSAGPVEGIAVRDVLTEE